MNFGNVSKIGRLLAALAVMLAFSAVSKADTCTTSSADSCSIDLSVTNFSSGTLASGTSYGTVTLTLNQQTGAITVDVQMAPGYALHNADFSWNGGTGDTVGTVSVTYGAGNPGLPVFGDVNGCGGQHGSCDGFGKFNYGFTGGTGNSSNYSDITFTVTQDGGFTSVGQLLAGNGDNENWFAGQVTQLSSGCTGWVANAGATNANPLPNTAPCTATDLPEPASIALLGTGLIALAGFVRKRQTL